MVHAEVAEATKAKGDKPIRRAIERCDEELRKIAGADLFEPQRSRYREILHSWREQLVEHAEKSVQVLRIFDEFNRHVYRASADALMTTLLELALQAAPLSYDERLTGEWASVFQGPTRLIIQRLLKGDTLIGKIFERGDRLVDATHLSGALLTLATSFHKTKGDLTASEERALGEEVCAEIESAAREWGLIPPGGIWHPDSAAYAENTNSWNTGRLEWSSLADGNEYRAPR